MKDFIKTHFWIVLILLYGLGVLAFTGMFILLEIIDGSVYDSSYLNRDIGKSLIVAIPPLLYPLYKYIKHIKNRVAQ